LSAALMDSGMEFQMTGPATEKDSFLTGTLLYTVTTLPGKSKKSPFFNSIIHTDFRLLHYLRRNKLQLLYTYACITQSLRSIRSDLHSQCIRSPQNLPQIRSHTVSAYGLYGHARSPVRFIRSVATVTQKGINRAAE